MLKGKFSKEKSEFVPVFGTKEEDQDIPKYSLRKNSVSSDVAYRLVKDELTDEGNSRLNMATFCQTYMEPEAVKLMSESMDKNVIDKSEYPRTAEIENRCVNIIADLWHASEDYLGTSTIGSSEACMLAGMSMKFSWEERVKKLGLDLNAKKPNLVISSGFQVCWEKFCTYWGIELREVPLDHKNQSLNMDKVMDYVDPYTIGIVGILGITYTGRYDNIKKLNSLVENYNSSTEYKVYIHVDAASGGFYTPFMDPDLKWDFRLNNVISINSSGHKYGLVYPGIGWVLWRDKKFLPEKLIFKVSYLGGEMPTIAINFSHSASQLIGQYYNFVRFGWDGYYEIHNKTHKVAMYIANEISKFSEFEIINSGSELPIVCYSLSSSFNKGWTLYDLADRLLMKGWQVPAYPLPKNLDNEVIQRLVIRADLGMNMAQEFVQDFSEAIQELNKAHILFHDAKKPVKYGFTH